MKPTSLVKWLRLDDRKYRGSKNAPDPWRPPPRRGSFLGRDGNTRVVVGEEDGCATFLFPKGQAVNQRLMYDLQHASQDTLKFFLARQGVYTLDELVRVLDQHREGRR